MSAARKMTKYETVIVTRTDAGQEAQKRLYEKIQELVQKVEGHHVRFELWGKRRLAFPIKKCLKGIYLYHVFLAGDQFIRDLNRMLKLNPAVLRYMTIVLEKDIDPATFDFEKERLFDSLPTDSDDQGDRSRSTTGWDAEFQNRGEAKADSEDDDDEDDEDEEGGENRKDKDGDRDVDEEEE
jgi:small subunit ribosomal protein S6